MSEACAASVREPAAHVVLKGTARGLEIQVAGSPTTPALAARLEELLAEAPAFFAGCDARVALVDEGELAPDAAGVLAEVASRFSLQIVEIGSRTERRPQPVPLAEGSGRIGDDQHPYIALSIEHVRPPALIVDDEPSARVRPPAVLVEHEPSTRVRTPVPVDAPSSPVLRDEPSARVRPPAVLVEVEPSTRVRTPAVPVDAPSSPLLLDEPFLAWPTAPVGLVAAAPVPAVAAPAPVVVAPPPEPPPPGPKLLVGPVRSGVVVEHPGHLIIVGDVNPGAEIRAEGSILVLGRLRGVAHAGIGGTGCIIALTLQPQQLRIGRQLARAADTDRPGGGAEIAFVSSSGSGDAIVVERFQGRLPSGLAASL